MQKGNSSNVQHELNAKLRRAQSLIGDAISLAAQLRAPARRLVKPDAQPGGEDTLVSFSMNERAFVKRYARDVVGGARKFVLLMAFLAKGDAKKDVAVSDLERLWNRTSSQSLIGMKFNRKFPTIAKEQGWVNSRKRGFYNLEQSWKDVFAND